MKFTIKKVPVSEEEKRDRAEFFAEDTGQYVDVEAFVKQDIYDEFIDYKCLNCKYEEELEADIVLEMFYPEFEEQRLVYVRIENFLKLNHKEHWMYFAI